MKTLWNKSNLKVRNALNCIGFLGPSFCGVLLFFILPFAVVVYYSVTAAVLMALAMVVLIALLFFIENRFGKDVEG